MLIITDGIINDFQETVDEIVRGTSLPLSILIVGVGEDDFKEMEDLDADVKPLYSQKFKKFMERDIVQFVPFLTFKNNANELARQTLEEIPVQLTQFMDSKKIKPMQLNQAHTGYLKNGVDYYQIKKQQFIEKAVQMGLPQNQVNALLQKGLPADSFELLTTHINNMYYNNPLK